MKQFLKIIFSISVIALIILIFVPILFQPKIENLVKTELNKQLNAKISFNEVKLSILSSFPDFKFEIHDLSVVGVNNFENDTLASIKKLKLNLDLISVIKGDNISIDKIVIDDPLLIIKVLEDGDANYNITQSSETETEIEEVEGSSGIKINLKSFEINRAIIVYDDFESQMLAVIQDLDFNLSGNLSDKSTELDIVTKIASFDFEYEGVRYLNSSLINFNGAIDADLENFVFKFLENQFEINKFPIEFTGMFGMTENDINLDFKYSSPKTDFVHLLSLVPAIYSNQFENITTNGDMAFSGAVKGIYNDNQMPAFNLDLLVENALFKYPDLPRSAENINIALQVSNPGGDVDFTEIWLKKFHVDLGKNPIDISMRIKSPVSDMYLDGQINGKLDFASIKDIIPIDDMSIQGNLDISLQMIGFLSAIENEQYSDFATSGNLLLKNFKLTSLDFPEPVEINLAEMSFSPESVELKSFDSKIGSSDMQLTGRFENYIPYVFSNEILIADFSLTSTELNLNKLLQSEEDTIVVENEESTPLSVVEIPNNIDFRFTSTMKKLIYDKLIIDDLVGVMVLKDSKLSMDKLAMNLLDGNMLLSGYYSSQNISAPEIDFNMNMKNIAIDKSYSAFQTVEKLAPLAKYCKGNISAGISLKSLLDETMNPIQSSINSSGNISSKNIVITNSKIFETLGDKLNIDKLKEPSISDFDAEFEIIDGVLEVKPFETKFAGQKATMSGSQGIDRSIDYKMALNIPSKKFAQSLTKAFPNQAAGLSADFINLDVLFIGTLDDPKVNVGLGKSGKSIKDVVTDKVKAEVETKIEKGKEDINAELKKRKEKLLSDAQKKADTLKEAAKKTAEKIRSEAKNKADKIEEAAKNKSFVEKKIAKKTADKLRKTANKKADAIIVEADKKADAIMKKAHEEAKKIKVN